MNDATTIIAERNNFEAISKRAAKFKSREFAFASVGHCHKPHRVMLGGDMRYWVVTPADAARLNEKFDYEYAE